MKQFITYAFPVFALGFTAALTLRTENETIPQERKAEQGAPEKTFAALEGVDGRTLSLFNSKPAHGAVYHGPCMVKKRRTATFDFNRKIRLNTRVTLNRI